MPIQLVMCSDQGHPDNRAVEQRLVALLAGRGSRVGYLPSAPDPERSWFSASDRHYASLGLSLEYYGVEDEFDAERRQALFDCDAIHLSGGNTFRFSFWLRKRGLYPALREYAQRAVLVGVSAGAILMTPDTGSAALCGDARYAPDSEDTGLGLAQLAMLPHFDGSATMHESWLRYSIGSALPVYAVPDGAGLVISDATVECVGPVRAARRGREVDV